MAIRVLFFDLDDTLYDTRGVGQAALAAVSGLARERCPDLTEDQIHAAYHAVVREVDRLLGLGHLSFTTAEELHLHRWREILARCEVDREHAPALAQRYRETRRANYRLCPEITGVLTSLPGDYRCALITNGPGELQREKIAACGLERWIPHAFISGELGVWKPHPEIFQHALMQMACATEEAVMIGDSLTNDIAGAAALGIRTVWVNRFGHTPPPEIQSDAVMEDLRPLPALLTGWR